MSNKITIQKLINLKKQKSNFLPLTLFIFWPFGTLIYSIKNFTRYESRNIVWLFAIFYGLVLVTTYSGLDAYRYAQDFISMAINQYSFSEVFGKYFIVKQETDIYEPLLMFIVSRFTSNPHIFYAIVGLIYGYFYSRNIWFLIDRIYIVKKVSNGFYLGILLLAFSFVQSLFSLQFVRFSTASVIFIYGLLIAYFDKKNAGYIWMLITPLVHFSFIFPLVLILIFRFIPKKTNLFFIFFVISTFIIQTKLEVISNFISAYAPSFLQDKVEGYTNPLYAEKVLEEIDTSNWYIKYRADMLIYLGYLYILYIYIQGKEILKKFPIFRDLFCFILFFYGISNIFGIVPSMNRFINLSLYMLFAFIILFYKKGPKTKFLQIINYVSVPVLFVYIVVGIRIAMETSGWLLFIGNPFLFLTGVDQAPAIEFIKRFF